MANRNIAILEMMAIIIACKLWGHQWRGLRLHLSCDNYACVQIINKGSARHSLLHKCLQELAWVMAKFEFQIKTVHLMGHLNKILDILSRWTVNPNLRRQFRQLNAQNKLRRVWPPLDYYLFSHSW